ncbi:DUF4433 domain-containing protein [Actinoplanes sp. CA-252034]|uniref:DUF4433 domain-containing protein n=1 Tax=Actinoplanes sp. CA-252034 TaxID=3239906 RepID=UPI003D99D302
MARGRDKPRRDNVRDWIVWHFTHISNIPNICQQERLLPSSAIQPSRSVANKEVKERRTFAVAPDESYPKSTVREHVPFYIAAKSPMLFVVTSSGSDAFKAPSSELVFFGVVVADLVDAGLTWCFSNGNAASSYTSFNRDLDQIGNFVDFDLLCATMWGKTTDDGSRPSRRAAECLVLNEVPLSLISLVATRTAHTLEKIRENFRDDAPRRIFKATDVLFYN